jgi:hypothetical protein
MKDQANSDGDEEAEYDSANEHRPHAKDGIGAGDDDRIDDGGSQEEGDTHRERQPLLMQAASDEDDATLADRERNAECRAAECSKHRLAWDKAE